MPDQVIWPIPRLRYRIRVGDWCDHRTYRYGSWMDALEHAEISHGRIISDVDLDRDYQPDLGMDNGQLVDMGRAKIYTCARCGWRTFHPDGKTMQEQAWTILPFPIAVGLFFGLSWLLYWLGVR
jgi:hypothetical protein